MPYVNAKDKVRMWQHSLQMYHKNNLCFSGKEPYPLKSLDLGLHSLQDSQHFCLPSSQ